MSSLQGNIQNWIINETNGLVEGSLRILPDISSIVKLTEGKNREIWKYVTKHVGSKESVAFKRRLLQVRRIQKEYKKYPDVNRENYIVLQNKVDNTEDKVRFIEYTTKNITKHVSFLNTSLKNKKEENCILNQKCAILELATLNLKERNKSLIVVIDQLFTLLNKSFANDKTKYFKYPIDRKSSEITTNEISQNFNFNDAFFNSILSEMMLIVKKKLLCEDVNLQVTNLVLPLTEIVSYTPSTDIVNLLKHISQQDLNSLQSNIEKAKQEEVERMSETYLQCMKQDFVDSCFQRKKLGYTESLLEVKDMHFIKDSSELHQDYLSMHIQNECLADSIQYLEKKIATELDITKNTKENYTKLKSQCQNIELIMGNFYKKLRSVHELFNLMPETFTSITFSLKSCRKFIDTQILSTIKCNKDDCFIDVANNIDCDSALSLDLLKSKEFLQDFAKDFTFTKLNFPAKVWNFLSLKPFQNRHLFIEKLVCMKRKLSVEPNQLSCTPHEISTSIAEEMFLSVKDHTDNMEVIKKNLFEVEKNCKKLEIVLKDWWDQDAQYIPVFEYNGKTLKMWLAILKVLD